MTNDHLPERVATDAAICHGQPHIRGTRVLVSVLLDALAAGKSAAEIAEHYPAVTVADIGAAVAYRTPLASRPSHVPWEASYPSQASQRQCNGAAS